MHSYTVFLVAFVEAFGWSRGETSIAYSVSQLVAGGSSPVVGMLVDRLGPRRLLLLGGGLLVLGLRQRLYCEPLADRRALRRGDDVRRELSRPRRLRADPVAPFRAASRHGDLDRAIGQRFRASAVGAAGAVFDLGHRLAPDLSGGGGLHGGGGLSARRLVPSRRPAAPRRAIGWRRERACFVAGGSRRAADGRSPRRCARRISGCCSRSICSPGSAVSSSRCTSSPSPSIAASTSSTPPRCSAWARFSRFSARSSPAPLSDYIGREVSAIMAYGFSIVGVICALFITGPDQGWLLWLHACLFGLTWGARGPAITAKTADLFPGAQLGAILGVITIGSGLGAALGSWGAGIIFDLSGSYELAFILSIIAYLCGVVAFWALRRPPVRRHQA
jgi:hypothetical protein